MARRVRLISGLILFLYVTTHLLNHILGLVSLEAIEEGRHVFLAIWRNDVGTLIFTAALVAHIGLSLWSLYARRSLKMPAGEALQLILGFLIPFLLISHIVGTRAAHEFVGVNDTYAYVLLAHFKFDPTFIPQQIAGLLAAWVHGCIGLHFWLRLKPGYRKSLPYTYAAAILIPVLSTAGYLVAGREVLMLAENPAWLAEANRIIQWPDRDGLALIYSIIERAQLGTALSILGAFAARGVRKLIERRLGTVRVTYPGGREIATVPGPSILDISKLNNIPHANVCGGRGRCSTCRVRITEGWNELPAPSPDELRVLERIGRPINVRLACQLHPNTDLEVVPILPPDASPRDGFRKAQHLQGQEKDIAVLFADIRSFTQFSEKKLPYDVVFVLNRYFANMGTAVQQAGGHLDKFIGDGVMALFGTAEGSSSAARDAMHAAKGMAEKLAELNRTLENDLDEPLRIGIGLHLGPAIIGEMGYGTAFGLTAIGDTVNTASRLESATKEFTAQLVVSKSLADTAGADLTSYPVHQIEVRGRSEPVSVYVIDNAAQLNLPD